MIYMDFLLGGMLSETLESKIIFQVFFESFWYVLNKLLTMTMN